MDDLISRQAAIDAVVEITYDQTALHHGWVSPYYVVKRLEYLPTADLSEYCDKLWKIAYERGKEEARPKKGKWIWKIGMVKCDQCLRAIRRIDCDGLLNFCPNCGAKMRGEQDE